MSDQKHCVFCGIANSLEDYCPNCKKFISIVDQHQSYMLELGEAQTQRLWAFFAAKELLLKHILEYEGDECGNK